MRRWLIMLAALPVLELTPIAPESSATIHPGTLGTDQNGNPWQLPGLGIVKVGNTYYGFGEDKVGEDQHDTSFRAIPCYRSTNLATWTYVREALVRQRSGDLGPHRI